MEPDNSSSEDEGENIDDSSEPSSPRVVVGTAASATPRGSDGGGAAESPPTRQRRRFRLGQSKHGPSKGQDGKQSSSRRTTSNNSDTSPLKGTGGAVAATITPGRSVGGGSSTGGSGRNSPASMDAMAAAKMASLEMDVTRLSRELAHEQEKRLEYVDIPELIS